MNETYTSFRENSARSSGTKTVVLEYSNKRDVLVDHVENADKNTVAISDGKM